VGIEKKGIKKGIGRGGESGSELLLLGEKLL
jgi:hypothetical protein